MMKVLFSLAALSLASTSAFQPISLHAVQSKCCGPSHKEQSLPHESNKHSTSFPLYSMMTDIEALASNAADTWGIETTQFIEPDLASKIEELFKDRADVIAFRVVGGRRRSLPIGSDDVSPGEGRRSRFVFMHPDLGLDYATAESEYCTVIRADNVNVAGSNTFPNALASIGVHLENIGDIVEEDSSTVCLVVDPTVAKVCVRLLSKELTGAGINLSVCEDNEFMPDGVMQEMKLSRILERQMERKKLEQGFVQFG